MHGGIHAFRGCTLPRVRFDECGQFPAQLQVISAGRGDKRLALGRWLLDRGIEERLQARPEFRRHNTLATGLTDLPESGTR